jgi:hypothetical protein
MSSIRLKYLRCKIIDFYVLGYHFITCVYIVDYSRLPRSYILSTAVAYRAERVKNHVFLGFGLYTQTLTSVTSFGLHQTIVMCLKFALSVVTLYHISVYKIFFEIFNLLHRISRSIQLAGVFYLLSSASPLVVSLMTF